MQHHAGGGDVKIRAVDRILKSRIKSDFKKSDKIGFKNSDKIGFI